MNTEQVLRSHGYKTTPWRRAFLSLLSERGATDITSLRSAFQERSSANTTTFYRTIAEFRSAGMVHILETKNGELAILCDCLSDGQQNNKSSHSVSYCLSCGNIEESHENANDSNIVRKFSESHVKHCVHCIK